jgi:soluble lytic murein transglycosylase-like protein
LTTWTRQDLETEALRMAARFSVDPQLVFAVINIESSWNARARGAAGEIGLMQLLPRGAIADWEQNGPAIRPGTGVDARRMDYWHPVANLMVGCWYLGERIPAMLRRHSLRSTVRNVIWAYNAGIGSVVAGRLPGITEAYLRKVERAGIALDDGAVGPAYASIGSSVGLGLALWALWQVFQGVRGG